MNRKIPVILCIDAEPDARLIERGRPKVWEGYESAHSYFLNRRAEIENITGTDASYSWFFRLDPQIAEGYGRADWGVDYYKDWIQDYFRSGDEVGLHPHAFRLDDKGWIADHGNQPWIEFCLDTAFEGFERNLGRPCRAFRFGDRWMNQDTMDYLENSGIDYNLTLEPGYPLQKNLCPDERVTGELPDTQKMPRFPYRPLANNYQIPDASRRGGQWVIPISSGPVFKKMGRSERLFKKIFRPSTLRPGNLTLNLSFGANGFGQVLDRILENEKQPYLAFVVRTDAFSNPAYFRNLELNFNKLLSHPLRRRFEFATPKRMMELLSQEEVKIEAGARACAVS